MELANFLCLDFAEFLIGSISSSPVENQKQQYIKYFQ